MKSAQVAILATILAASCPAFAATINLRETSCSEFLALSKDDLTYSLAFLDGYYRTEDDPLVIDQDRAGVKSLAEYCIANPTEGLIDAADKLFKR